MHISYLFPLALLAALLPAVLACTKTEDCCWGGADNGFTGCYNQHNFSDDKCRGPEYTKDYCSAQGVKKEQCWNDCCSIKTKKAITCPGKGGKNGKKKTNPVTKFFQGVQGFFGSIFGGLGGLGGGGGSSGGSSGGSGGGIGSMFGGGGGDKGSSGGGSSGGLGGLFGGRRARKVRRSL